MTELLILAGCFLLAWVALKVYDAFFNADPPCPKCSRRSWDRYAHTTDMRCLSCGALYDPIKGRLVRSP
jgi:hypothetical protein